MNPSVLEPLLTFKPELQKIRHTLHAHPELAYQEQQTADFIARQLDQWKIPYERGIAGTGIVASLKRGQSDKAVGLRADMDALPIQELNTFAHRSQHLGKMHACGHDGHVAMLLGAAYYLSQHGNFDGTVHFIFQPAEEGGGGARRMIEEGLFERFAMQAVFALHNWPGLPLGHFGVRSGAIMASSNEFYLRVIGRGGHAAMPHQVVDPIIACTHIVQSWQSIVSRNVKPVDAAVISVTQIHAGNTTNVIPDDAKASGTVRTFNHELLDLIEQRMRQIAHAAAVAFEVQIEFEFKRNYPPTINDSAQTAFAQKVMCMVVGEKAVDTQVDASMGAEDFAYMLQKKPGCYAFIGNGALNENPHANEPALPCQLHHPHYDFNDALLPIGASYWVKLVENFLE